MKKLLNLVLITTLCFANSANAVNLNDYNEDYDLLVNAEQFIGNISIALREADNNNLTQTEEALKKAEENLEVLSNYDLTYQSEHPVKIGKLSYSIYFANKKYKIKRFVLLPFNEEKLAVTLNPEEKKRNILRSGAEVVYFDIEMNNEELFDFIAEVKHSLAEEDMNGAAKILQRILRLEVGNAGNVPTDRLQPAYDNLMFAHSLLHEKEYKYSRLALRNASRQLKTYANTEQGKYDMQIKAISNEISHISQELKEEKPSMARKAQTKIKVWLKTMGSWFVPSK